MSKMRESLFSILGDIDGLSFLDLYAGSGIMALEAHSRGATNIHLVEKDRRKRPVTLGNIRKITGDEQPGRLVYLHIRPVEQFLRIGMERFDVVFCDPPFSLKNKETILTMAERAGQPTGGGRLIIHHPAEDELPPAVGALKIGDQRKYGHSRLTFYTRDD